MTYADELLDTKRITRNMVESGTGIRAVIASKRAPYVKSLYGNRLHKTRAVRKDYRTATIFTLLAVFQCGDCTMHPHFADSDELCCATEYCPKCFPGALT